MSYAIRGNSKPPGDLSTTLEVTEILKDISVEFEGGLVYALCGLNGAGKSTFMRICVGLLQPTCGEILIHGQSLLTLKERAKLVSYGPERFHIPFAIQVRDLMMLGRFPHHSGRPQKLDHETIDEQLARLGLESFALKPFNHLSSGEMRLVMVARCLAQKAPYVFLDEPFANLDYDARKRLKSAIKAEAQLEGTIFVVSLHDFALLEGFTDRILALNRGGVKTFQDFNPQDLAGEFGLETGLVHGFF